MSEINQGVQSQRIFGGDRWEWRMLEAEEEQRMRLPPFLADQVFRVVVARAPGFFLFEALVSEQCPKDAYSHVAKGVRRICGRPAVLNLVHGRSANAHLVLLNGEDQDRFHHLDLDFSHLSRFDRYLLGILQRPTAEKVERLFRLLEGQNLSRDFQKTLRDHLKRIPCCGENAYHALVDLVLKLVFLIFVQRKGWLNFDPYYLETKMRLCHRKGLSIIHCFLKPLFARLEGGRIREIVPLGELPRLGGGLFCFQPENLPVIANDWCLNLYEALISQYSFSLFEARENREILGVSPVILGHVFENLLRREERRQQGAFYTPQAVAEKQVKAAFQAFLRANGLEGNPSALGRRLPDLRVLDPSCGSGAYLLAAFQVLVKLRLSLAPERERYNGKLYALKRAVVLENLYGMDIHPMAVRLTEVRLWLNMIQDLEISEPAKAPALPSLQHHIRPGDFLRQYLPETLKKLESWPKYGELERLRKHFPTSSGRKRQARLKHIYRLERELFEFLDMAGRRASQATARNRAAQGMLPGHQRGRGDLRPPRSAKAHAQLHIMFSDVMLQGGFDLILGNPPWRSANKIRSEQKRQMVAHLHSPPDLPLDGRMDLSLFFLIASLRLVKPGGQLSFLLPGKLLQARYADKLRAYLRSRWRIDFLFDYGIDHKLIFHADTFPLVLGITSLKPAAKHRIQAEVHGRGMMRSFFMDSEDLADPLGRWRLRPREASQRASVTRAWVRLEDRFRIHRGILTHAKKHFVFDNKPAHLPPEHLRPLLRGRDLKPNRVFPGQWIYWPFDLGAHWFSQLSTREQGWLRRTGKLKEGPFRARLSYGPKPLGPWLLVWKYLAARWTLALVRAGDWIPDQTTYYINFKSFAEAYPWFVYGNSPLANRMLCDIAERGKARCYFFYAHTCNGLPLPPALRQRIGAPQRERDVLTPSQCPTLPDAYFLTTHKDAGLLDEAGEDRAIAVQEALP